MKFSHLILLLYIILFMVAVSSAQSATIHVPADQPTIQAGINIAIVGDTVLVADGIYTGPGNRDIDFGGKNIVLKSENGPDVTIIDCQGTESEPHRGFYFHSGEDSTAVVDGFTIQGGFGLYDDPSGRSVGGGIKCESSSSPKIINNTISGNSAFLGGGGIFCADNSSATISNNNISGNSASNPFIGRGGGIYCYRSNPTISNNTISGDSARFGGGIYCEISSPTISNNTISGNSANTHGGGIYCFDNSSPTISNNNISGNSAIDDGGGIGCFDSSPTISDNTISGNSANRGGGIACFRSSPTISNNTISENAASFGGGGIFCHLSNPTISNNNISGNSARIGGGIYCFNNSSPTISNSTISENAASFGGGGIGCAISDPTIINNNISGNSANTHGGGIYCFNNSSPTIINNNISGNSGASNGGGIFCVDNSNPTISNNSISGNTAGRGAGLYSGFDSSPSVEYCIFAFNSGSEAIWCDDETSVPTLTCCDIYGNESGDWVGCIAGQEGINGNFSLDPLFCDTAAGDFHLRSSFSPCLPQHSPCGLLVGALGLGCSGAFICADANGDLLVNVDDVDFLIDYYFYSGTSPVSLVASDLNCDGSVNIADITYLAAYINGTGVAPCCAE